MKQTENFTTGAIFAPLIKFALPVLLAMFLQTMYGAVDLMIVGKFGGDLADVYVSAVSTGSMVRADSGHTVYLDMSEGDNVVYYEAAEDGISGLVRQVEQFLSGLMS